LIKALFIVMCLLGCVGHAEGVGGSEPVEVSDRSEVYSHAAVRHPVVFTGWDDVSADGEEAVWEFELTVDKGRGGGECGPQVRAHGAAG
jgi:hypothetical protein